MSKFTRPVAPKPEKVQLGNGIVAINFNPDNWNDQEMILLGATRGGGNYNVEKTNRAIRFDGDKGENTKGLKVIDEWVINIVVNTLEVDLDALKRAIPGDIAEPETSTGNEGTPAYRKLRPRAEYTEEDYFKNIAYITRTFAGNVVAYVVENPLGDGNLTAAFEDKNEVVPELTFSGHFDPKTMDEVPTFIVEYSTPTEPIEPEEDPEPEGEN